MTYDNTDEVIEEIFESLLSRYQIGLKTSMKRSDFIFDSIQMLYYKCHKINFKCSILYTESPNWIKNKKTTINPKNQGDTCLQCAVTVALNYGEIKWNPE